MSPTLVILAAGMGSRYGGLKQMAALGPQGQSILDYSIYDAARAGFGSVVFVIRRDFDTAFREHTAPLRSRHPKLDFRFAYQEQNDLPGGFAPPAERSKPWGTGHAVWCARNQIKEPFAVINADDFYGAESFRLLADFLKNNPPASTKFALAGFRLGQTLSEHGTVSRGLCRVDANGFLTSIEEITGLEPDPATGGARVPSNSSPSKNLPADAIVSMNCWAFTPAVFPMLESELTSFLRTRASDPKSEFYLPAAIGSLISAKKASVAVLSTNARWFGVTHRGDEPTVRAALKALHDSGEYPGV